MNVTDLSPIAVLQRPNSLALTLRASQRIAAEVLQVSGDQAILALEGVRVVAQLTSPEQAAALQTRRFAQFIVRDLSSQVITLQLAQAQGPPPASSLHSDGIPALLQSAGLPADPANTLIAHALINQGLPVTPELILELRKVLDSAAQRSLGKWGQAEAETAALLKASGLPMTAETLTMKQMVRQPMAQIRAALEAQLQSLARNGQDAGMSPRVAKLLQQTIETLDRIMVDWSDTTGALAEKLRQAIAILGLPLERELAEMAQGLTARELAARDLPGLLGPDGGQGHPFLALALLRGELAREGLSSLAKEIDHFLDSLRTVQFSSLPPDNIPLKEHWLSIDLPLGSPAAEYQGQAGWQQAHIHIASNPENEANRGDGQIDPANTRLVIEVGLSRDESLKVDLSIVDRRIGARVTASNEELRQRAAGAMANLQAGLEKVGYTLQTACCETEQPKVQLQVGSSVYRGMAGEVSVEV